MAVLRGLAEVMYVLSPFAEFLHKTFYEIQQAQLPQLLTYLLHGAESFLRS